MKDQIIPLWVHLSRAYEIALLGNFTIELFHSNEDYPTAHNDFPLIKDFYNDILFVPSDGHIKIDLPAPNKEVLSYSRRHETIQDIRARVVKAKTFTRPKFEVNESGNRLFKTAIDRLALSLDRIDKIKQVACIIAQLENSPIVKIEHLAEAIQYQSIDTVYENNKNVLISTELHELIKGIALMNSEQQANLIALIKNNNPVKS